MRTISDNIKRGARIIMTVLILAVALPLTGLSPSEALEEATLRLDWRLLGYHAPYYYALDKGYWKDEGIDLKIMEGQGSGDTVKVIAAGTDTFGFADLSVMAVGITKGMPLKGVFGLIQKTHWTIVSHENDNIKAPKDLSGKSVALVGGVQPLLNVFLRRNGVNPEQVQLRTVTADAFDKVFTGYKVDTLMIVMSGYGILLKDWAQKSGNKISFLNFKEWGTNILAHGIMVNKNTLDNKPDIAKKFLRGFKKGVEGVEEAPKNIDEAIAIAIKYVPVMKGKEHVLKEQYLSTPSHYHTEATKGKPIGWMDKSDWEQTQNVLLEAKLIEKPLPVQSYYTNEFIPQ